VWKKIARPLNSNPAGKIKTGCVAVSRKKGLEIGQNEEGHRSTLERGTSIDKGEGKGVFEGI